MSNPGVLRLFLFGTALQHRTVGSRVHPGLVKLEEKIVRSSGHGSNGTAAT